MTSNAVEPPATMGTKADLGLGPMLLALAGPLVWAVHFMLAYLAAEGACRLNALGGSWLGLTGLGWFTVVVTVLALGLNVWAGWRAYRRWRAARAEHGAAKAARPLDLAALAGWTLSLLFTVLIVLSLVTLVVLRPCAWL